MSSRSSSRIAIAGFGAWGQMHAKAIASIDHSQITSIYCRSEASRKAASELVPGAKVFGDYETMLRDANADVVDVTVPNFLHADYAVSALESGRHVFLEKPIGLDLQACDRVIDAARKTGLRVAVNHELRVSHQWGKVRDLAAEGNFGDIRYQHFSLFRHPFRQGSGGWRYDGASVGSWILEELVHFFDLILWYGRENGLPQTVFAAGTRLDSGQFDNITVTLKWENGAVAQLSQCLSGFQHHSQLEIGGTKGALRTWWSGAMDRTEHPDFSMTVTTMDDEAPREVPIERSGEIFELKANLDMALQAFRNGEGDILGPEEAALAIAVCLAAEQSAATGRILNITYPTTQ